MLNELKVLIEYIFLEKIPKLLVNNTSEAEKILSIWLNIQK
jgi:hypothetical protein